MEGDYQWEALLESDLESVGALGDCAHQNELESSDPYTTAIVPYSQRLVFFANLNLK